MAVGGAPSKAVTFRLRLKGKENHPCRQCRGGACQARTRKEPGVLVRPDVGGGGERTRCG